jgi:excinuclease UvrABC helicase subunit UvrB
MPDVRREAAMRRNEVLSQAIRILTEHGFMPVIEQGRHIKVRWFDGERQQQLIVPCTPSDHRALLNSRSVLKRIIRNSGMVERSAP